MKITIRNSQKKIPIHPKKIKEVILKALSIFGKAKKNFIITLCIVSDRKIQELNLRYLKKDFPTDVLAFDLSDPKKPDSLVADIIVSADTAIKNAGIYRTWPSYELYLYLAHGALHLVGYDDRDIKQRQLMRKKEKEILKTCLSIRPKP